MANLLGSSSTAKQTSESALDPQIKDAFLNNYSNVQKVASNLPVQQFSPQTGQFFAGENTVNNAATTANRLQNTGPMFITSPSANGSTAGVSTADASLATSTGYTGVGYDPTYANSRGYSPLTGSAAQLNGSDISNYMNPFTSQVTDTTLSDLDRARRMSLVDNSATATRSGAYGGTRQAVADSLTNESFGRTAASTLANLNNTNYNTALTAAQNDVSNRQQTNLANLGYGNTAAQFGAGAYNTAALTNAGYGNTASQFGANATNTANQFTANAANTASLFNAGQLNDLSKYNSGQINNTAMFNTGQTNDLSKYNAGLNLNTQTANQNAYANNLSQQLAAANSGNTIGGNQANLGMTSQAYNQAILDAQRNLPLQQLALTNQALGKIGRAHV